MIKLSNTLGLMLFLVGCSNEEHPLINSEKARLVTEQVLDIPKCSDFRNKLLLPNVGDVEIEKIYQDATKSGCINKDI
jgi:PBP1b-binding outer membrane lipoprotein LpoB